MQARLPSGRQCEKCIQSNWLAPSCRDILTSFDRVSLTIRDRATLQLSWHILLNVAWKLSNKPKNPAN
jgi:hypothetical protein